MNEKVFVLDSMELKGLFLKQFNKEIGLRKNC